MSKNRLAIQGLGGRGQFHWIQRWVLWQVHGDDYSINHRCVGVNQSDFQEQVHLILSE